MPLGPKPKLRPQLATQGTYRGVPFKIVNWKFETAEFNEMTPTGQWNYYVFLHEKNCVNFAALWLEDKLVQVTPESPVRVTNDYYVDPLSSIEIHGGITWYEKHGYVEGHRCVEIGCDYSHVFDDGQHYDWDSILNDVMETIDSCYSLGLLKPDSLQLTFEGSSLRSDVEADSSTTGTD